MLQKITVKEDPRVRRTRQMLQQATIELMDERELADINVQDIAERADLNRATFYRHFLDKYDLFDSILSERFQSMLKERLPETASLTATHLNILIQTGYDCVNSFHRYCKVAHNRHDNSQMMNQIQQQMNQVLLGWLQDNGVRSKLGGHSPEIIALSVSWMIAGPIIKIARDTSPVPEQERIQQLGSAAQAALQEYLLEN